MLGGNRALKPCAHDDVVDGRSPIAEWVRKGADRLPYYGFEETRARDDFLFLHSWGKSGQGRMSRGVSTDLEQRVGS